MRIQLDIDGTALAGTLEDSAAGRDFASLLPLTLTLTDHAGTEKISDLPRRLDTTGAPEAAAADAGDLSYYAPWGNLALFYRPFRRSQGLVRLGRLDAGAAPVLADLADGTTITIRLAGAAE